MKYQDNIHQDTWRATHLFLFAFDKTVLLFACSLLTCSLRLMRTIKLCSLRLMSTCLLIKLNTQDILSIKPNEHERVLIRPNAHVHANGHDIYIIYINVPLIFPRLSRPGMTFSVDRE